MLRSRKSKKYKIVLISAFSLLLTSNLAAQKECIENPDPAAQIKACKIAIDQWSTEQGKPRLALYHRSLAVAYTKEEKLSQTQKYEYALENIEKAIGYDPDEAQNFLVRGWIFNRFNFYDRAIESFEIVTKLTPTSEKGGWGYYNLAISYSLINKPDIAEKHLKAARQIAPNLYDDYLKELEYFTEQEYKINRKASEHFSAGLRAFSEKKYKQALEFFEKSIELQPRNSKYTGWLGVTYFEMGNFEKATEILTQPPPEERWNYYIGLCYVAEQKLEKARDLFEKAITDTPPKNRGQNIKTKAQEYRDKLNKYLSFYTQAQEAAVKGKNLISAELAGKALENLKTRKALELREDQLAIYAKKQKAKKILPWLVGFIIIALVFAIVFSKMTGKIAKNILQSKKRQQTLDIAQQARLNPKGIFLQYLAEKNTGKQNPLEVAKKWSKSIALTRDTELLEAFTDELAPEDRKNYLLTAAWDLLDTKQTENAKHALLFVNKISFDQWGPEEAAAFTQGHLICDEEILTDTKENRKFWHKEIPSQAYHTLARKYSVDGKYDKANAVILKIPMYKWDDKLWQTIITIKTAQNTLDTVEISTLPENIKTTVMEKLFHEGHTKKVTDYILTQNEESYKPDFYFYLFAYFAKTDFDKAWQYYGELCTKLEVNQDPKVFYAIALLCEILEKYNKALEIYEKITFAAGDYKDVRNRKLYIRQSQGKFISPPAGEILANILPPDFSTIGGINAK